MSTLQASIGSGFGAASNRKVTEDRMGTQANLLAEFPYLGPPHNDRQD